MKHTPSFFARSLGVLATSFALGAASGCALEPYGPGDRTYYQRVTVHRHAGGEQAGWAEFPGRTRYYSSRSVLYTWSWFRVAPVEWAARAEPRSAEAHELDYRRRWKRESLRVPLPDATEDPGLIGAEERRALQGET